MRFIFDDYAHDNSVRYAMRCRDRKEAEIFLTYLDSLGRRWNGGRSYLDFDYGWDPDYPCFIFREGLRTGANSCTVTLLEFSDFEWGDEEPISIEMSLDSLF